MIVVNNIKKITQGKTIATLTCDDSSDVELLEGYGNEHNLMMGSVCFCVGEAKKYMMKSDGSWVSVGGGGSYALRQKNITENGTYKAIVDGCYGFSKVFVDVEGGEPYQVVDYLLSGDVPEGVIHTGTPKIHASIYRDMADIQNQYLQSLLSNLVVIPTLPEEYSVDFTLENLSEVENYIDGIPHNYYEYQGYITDDIKTTYNLERIYTYYGPATVNINIEDGLDSYDAILLQSAYEYNERNARNITMIYDTTLNVTRWTGRIDRTWDGSVYTTFTSNTTAKIDSTYITCGMAMYGIRKINN